MKTVLFVCTANVDRSKTAEDFFSEQFEQIRFMSAGTSKTHCAQADSRFLTQEILDSADEVLVMEEKHREWILRHLHPGKIPIEVLEIPDVYSYYSIGLIELLQRKCATRF